MSQFVHELERVLLTHRTACLVAQDRYEAHAVASVDGPQFAPANGKRMLAPMRHEQQHYAYHAASRRQVLRERGFEEMMLGGKN